LAGRATSIETELGRPIDRAPCLVALLARLRAIMDRLHADGREAICRDWRTFGTRGLRGAAVRWAERGGDRRGHARDIDADGALLVDVDGRVERIIAGEVIWES
jgi:BirA family biotin operon repressor/biotin-[acetyl-CoA-carboxylase] ligase